MRLTHTLALLSSRAGIDVDTLAWLLDHAVALGWAEPDHLPYAAGQPVTSFDAWERLRAGATLVQAYTGFVYGGPLWPRRMHAGLAARLRSTAS